MLSKGQQSKVLDFKLKEKEGKRFQFNEDKMTITDMLTGEWYQLTFNQGTLWAEVTKENGLLQVMPIRNFKPNKLGA